MKINRAVAKALLSGREMRKRIETPSRPQGQEPLILRRKRTVENEQVVDRPVEVRTATDMDPPTFTDTKGRVRVEAVAAKGFTVGQRFVPWPTVSVWGILLGLPLALEAYRKAIFGKQLMLAVAFGQTDEKGADNVGLLFDEADRLYRESGIKFVPERETDISINIAWGLLYPLLEDTAEDWPQNLLQRARTDEEIATLDNLNLGLDLANNAEEIISTIGAYFRAPERGGATPFVLP